MEAGVYLDFAGAALPSATQMEALTAELQGLRLGNPHSRHSVAVATAQRVDAARTRVLAELGTTEADYAVVWTSGATAALRLLAESFDFGEQGTGADVQDQLLTTLEAPLEGPAFLYSQDNHTSAVGMRESNFCGRKYPLDWIEKAKSGALGSDSAWFVCLDAASLLSSSPLDLRRHRPDFLTISFYKMFGYPTGLGALVVRRGLESLLRPAYFGGGSVGVALAGRRLHRPRADVAARLESGTLNYYAISSLRHGFDEIRRLGGMDNICKFTFKLTELAFNSLQSLQHGNGRSLVHFYIYDRDMQESKQGAILNFNLVKDNGDWIGYSEVEKMADLYCIHLRTGCFCNLGACQAYLHISDHQLLENFKEGKLCGDSMDLVDGRPVGSVRVSFGASSKVADVAALLGMLFDCFLQSPPFPWAHFPGLINDLTNSLGLNDEGLSTNAKISNLAQSLPPADSGQAGVHHYREPVQKTKSKVEEKPTTSSSESPHLESLMVYPVKSMRGIRLSSCAVGRRGLELDRSWVVVDGRGVALTQKRTPVLCSVCPSFVDGNLVLEAPNSAPLRLPCTPTDSAEPRDACLAKVCSDRVSAVDCGEEAAGWITAVIGQTPCRILRQASDQSRQSRLGNEGAGNSVAAEVSLANEAQFLLLNEATLALLYPPLQDYMSFQELLDRFRGNLIISGAEALAEEQWQRIQIGDTTFKVVGRCTRCQMVCVDQQSGAKDPAVLSALRSWKGEMKMGIYLAAEESAGRRRLSAGDALRVLSPAAPS